MGLFVLRHVGVSLPPLLSSVDHDLSDTLGGATFVAQGLRLTGVTAVLCGGAPVTSFHVDSATQITFVTAAHASGSAPLTVVGPGGASNALAFEFWDPTVPHAVTWFGESGGYANVAGTGTWTKRAGTSTNATESVHPPTESPAGNALFVAASNDRLVGPDTGWNGLIGASSAVGFTIAVCLDVTAIAGAADAIISDASFYGAFYLSPDNTCGFAYYDDTTASYVTATAPIPATGRVVILVERDVSSTPSLKLSVDGGATWHVGGAVHDLRLGTAGIYCGFNAALALYPLSASFRALVTLKAGWSDADADRFLRWTRSRLP